MATFFVRYFEIFGVDCDTGANITTIPADIDDVADYARDPVLKLWNLGLLSGDGVNFNPGNYATRAQAASLCMLTHQAVKVWYQEPGVPSVDGEAGLGDQTIIPNLPSGNVTRYYNVAFELGEGQTAQDVTMPEAKTYASGTKVEQLPTSYARGQVFLGWYYGGSRSVRTAVRLLLLQAALDRRFGSGAVLWRCAVL